MVRKLAVEHNGAPTGHTPERRLGEVGLAVDRALARSARPSAGPGAITVRSVRAEDRAAWDGIAQTSDDAWLTHSWDWNARIEEGVMGGERRSLVVLQDDVLVGIVPQHLHSFPRGPFTRRVLYANYWAGGGVALTNDLSPAARREACAGALRATHEQARADGADKLVLFLPPLARRNLRGDVEARRALAGDGFVDRSSTALVVRLTGRTSEEVWSAMEGRARTKARKAERAGVCVTKYEESDVLDVLYPLHLETCRRGGTPPYPKEYFEATLASGHFHVFIARLEDRPIGALTLGLFAGRALFNVSASDAEALRLGANNLLIWRALQWLLQRGAEAFELGVLPDRGQPVSPKLASIAWHHRSFGGEEVPAYVGQFVYRRGRETMFALGRQLLRTLRTGA
jgi:hypothetical protein